MAQTTRQTNLLVNQDWTKVYQAFTNADFTSYDFETLRNSMINYLKTYYPDTFNDFLESSEYLALIDMIAFLGQSLSFRTDLNARENFIDTAQRRDSILKLARMLAYNPTRTQSASGLMKFDSVSTTENITDSSGINLANTTIYWNDLTNSNWLEQFTSIINAALNTGQAVGKPANSQAINGIQTDEYSISLSNNSLPVAPFTVPIQTTPVTFEAVSATTVGQTYIYENPPVLANKFNILYRNDNNGNSSNNTGFFLYFKQGSLQATNFTVQNAIPNNLVPVNSNNINNTDAWLYGLNVSNGIQTVWSQVPALTGINVVYNQSTNKNLYQIATRNNDQVTLVFGDGSFSNVPQGSYRFYFRSSNGLAYTITPDDLAAVTIAFPYYSRSGSIETLTVTASLKYTVTNATASESLQSIKAYAPQQYYTQNRMITGEDYNIFPLTTFTSIQKVKAVNRTSSGVSPYLDALDPTGSFSGTNIFCDDGYISANTGTGSDTFSFLTTNEIYSAIYNNIIPIIGSTEMVNYYYANYPRYTPFDSNITFVQTGNSTSSSYGNLTYNGNAVSVGTATTGNLQYVSAGASIKFLTNVNANATTFYSTVTNTIGNSQTSFGMVVPNGSVVNSIIPAFKNNFSSTLIGTIATQIAAKVNFGLTFDQVNQTWMNVPPAAIGTDTTWLLKFVYNAGLYNIQYKKLTYVFGSRSQTKFYFDPSVKVYDSIIGANISDLIKILKINTQPNSTAPLASDIVWNIYDVITEADGYVQTGNVLVTSPQLQMTGVPDNPDLFSTVSNTSTYRDSLYFQYKHNSPGRNRIDPTPVNIVDLYVLTADYAASYVSWLRDLTGTVKEPVAPTTSSLEIAYSNLDNFKAVSDTIIYNSAKFKPLFGAKADPSLQARFQVVINPAVSLTPNEVKTQVINAINAYFDVNNWNFGDTFYFSELAAYLHTTLVPNIASVLIVPVNDTLVFGNYFQINAEPWEIITSAATVDNIDIISAVTAAQLNLGNNLIGTY